MQNWILVYICKLYVFISSSACKICNFDIRPFCISSTASVRNLAPNTAINSSSGKDFPYVFPAVL